MEAGFYNGSGTVADYDSNKDFIGRLHTSFEGELVPWQLGVGISIYSGGQRQNSRYSYTMQEGNVAGSSYFYTVDSAESNIGKTARRRYYRSEEHTSELQSLMRISYAVFCLKQKKHKTTILISTENYTKKMQ